MGTTEIKSRTGAGYEKPTRTPVGKLLRQTLRYIRSWRQVTEERITAIAEDFGEELRRAAAEKVINIYMDREAGAIQAVESLPEDGFSRQVITIMNERISKLVEPPAGADGSEWTLIEEEKGQTKRYKVSITEEAVLDEGHILTEEIVELRNDINWPEADGRKYNRKRFIDSNGKHMLLSLEVASGRNSYGALAPSNVKFFNTREWDFDLKRDELHGESNVIVVKTPKGEYYINTDQLNTAFEQNARLRSERGWPLFCRDIFNILNDAGA